MLGRDDATSTDHDWGPRLQLFFEPEACDEQRAALDGALTRELPPTYRGFATRFPASSGRAARADRAATHHVEVTTIEAYFSRLLGFRWTGALSVTQWLATPSQVLLELTTGRVFCDALGLQSARAALAWYPDDVWRYLLACSWQRIGQEQPFAGRAGQVGDELGAQLVAARLVRDLMTIGFLLERVYPPYAKWFGSAFAELCCASELLPLLDGVVRAGDWHARDRQLSAAASRMVELQNALGLCDPHPANPKPFYTRPFSIIDGEAVAQRLVASLCGDSAAALRALPLVGSIDQLSDSTDFKAARLRPALAACFDSAAAAGRRKI